MKLKKISLLAASIAWSPLALQAATTWNAAADFITNEKKAVPTNANGQWSYGYRDSIQYPTSGPTITLYTTHSDNINDPDVHGWRLNPAMIAAANVSDDDVPGLLEGQMFVHPLNLSTNPTYNVIRWTAVDAGVYSISASWFAISTATGVGKDGTDAYFVLNGVAQSGGNLGLGGTLNLPSHTRTLAAGAVLEFVVGPGPSGNSDSDTTIFDAHITLIPEPSTTLLIATAIPLLFVRRRKNAL